ncbi:MAG: phage exclusion protein Lit family protein [Gemmatimonadaceae bacterium]
MTGPVHLPGTTRYLSQMGPTIQLPAQSNAKTAYLHPFIGNVLERIAPERARELDRFAHVPILVIESRKPVAYAMLGEKAIVITARMTDLLWAVTYAHWIFYTRFCAGVMPDGATVDLTQRADLTPVLTLLSWATEELRAPAGTPWPDTLPQPVTRTTFSPTDDATEERVVDELTLAALAFILHHELAHLYITPEVGESSIDHERACDLAAGAWIFGEPAPEGDRAAEKRAVSVAAALLFIASIDLTRTHAPTDHPIGVDRLADVLDPYIDVFRESVWGFAVGILALHAKGDVSIPPVEHETFRSAAIAYRDAVRARVV